MLEPGSFDALTSQEIDALKSAASWYAKYHARIIAESADDPSAYALAQRDRYLALLSGLDKLGVQVRNPLGDARPEVERKAA
ncbi:MAG: hypothetical protein BroJett022_10220 [Actinomycetes bacterium]|nr:MAG: hypothetical protein BroJett022_10220 [Actinomycetes bacterium]